MHKWPAKQARARFGAMLNACLADGPKLITRRGIEAAVLMRTDEWHRLQSEAPRSLKQLLLDEGARYSSILPSMTRASRRTPVSAR